MVTTAARAEFHSTHPLALTSHALANDVGLTPLDQFEQMIGMGIHAQWIGDSILVGNLRYLGAVGLPSRAPPITPVSPPTPV